MPSIVINDFLSFIQDQWNKLGDETIESILARLPVADYVPCQVVSKRWKSIIRSPTFPTTSREFFNRLPWVLMMNISMYTDLVYDMEVDEWREVRLPILMENLTWATPFAASNGLLGCVCDNELFVCNPLTERKRDVVMLERGEQYKAVAMHVFSPSSYAVCLVQLREGGLSMHILLPVTGQVTTVSLVPYKLVKNSVSEKMYTRQPMYGELTGGIFWEWLPSKSSVVTVNNTGELVVYYLESNGQLMGCYSKQKIALMFPPILLGEFMFDLVECHGRILVLTLANEDGTAMLRVWEFDDEKEQWKNVASMPPEMSEGYNGINPWIDATACGHIVTICFSSIHYNFNKVAVFNLVKNTWKELPTYVDPRCGQSRRFCSVVSIMPDIECIP